MSAADCMDVAELRRLARLMEEEGLVELEVEGAAGRVRLVRAAGTPVARSSRRGRGKVGDMQPGPEVGASPTTAPVEGQGIAILSPMVGTFYRAPAPGAAPFVEVGEWISAGQVVCIVEAMKMMNEVRAEAGGRVLRVLAEDGQAVEYGAGLFAVEPAE